MNEQPQYDLRGPAAREVLREWWRLLNEDRPGRPIRRGDRANLRRCHGLAEVALDKAFHDLRLALEGKKLPVRHNGPGLAAAALVLAHVRTDAGTDGSLARLMAQPGQNPSKGRVSGLRFRRLLALDDLEDLTQALIRVVRLLDGTASVVSLASDILDWADPRYRQSLRQRWANDYYASAPDAHDEHAA